MPDKQIIDVSKCEYYKEYSDPNEDGDEYNDVCECSITESAFCFDECNSNCYFKNWQHKERECDELNLENFDLKDRLQHTEFVLETANSTIKLNEQQLDQLKVENEELKNAYARLNALYNDNCNFTGKLEETLTEIIEIAKPYQKEIKKICGNCDNYDDSHACCRFDLNCYQYKKGDTKACDKFIELKKFEINNLANKILQKGVENEIL